jgi:hypothetical protein
LDLSKEDLTKFKWLENERENMLKWEEVKWHQKSKAAWMTKGDENMKFLCHFVQEMKA